MRHTYSDREKHDLHMRMATNRTRTLIEKVIKTLQNRSDRPPAPWYSAATCPNGSKNGSQNESSLDSVRGQAYVEIVFFPVRNGVA